jgi:DNA-binding response OmpR family regulator
MIFGPCQRGLRGHLVCSLSKVRGRIRESGMADISFLDSWTGKVVSARVLVVENEFMIGLDVGEHLASAGYEVVGVATSVRKALRLEPTCDVAVLDVNLGPETCEPVARKLRASGKPFVVLTGYFPDNLASCFNDATILTKPPCMDDVVAAVRACVDAMPKAASHV